MRLDELGTKMRKFEWIGEAQVPSESCIILRLDGKGFSKFTQAVGFLKPCDDLMNEIMISTAKEVMTQMEGYFATTHSDEISVLLKRDFSLYNREIAKLVSISASIASSKFTMEMTKHRGYKGPPISFDSRIWCSESAERVIDYYYWRSLDAARCSLNGYCYWTLRSQGLSAAKATRAMHKKGSDFKFNLLRDAGISWADLDEWKKTGVVLFSETYEKEGFDPIKKQTVLCTRNQIVNKGLPVKEDLIEFLQTKLGAI
jgi:tRNA(His) guanylyltransferase